MGLHFSCISLLLSIIYQAKAANSEVTPMVVTIGDSFSAGTGVFPDLESYDVPYGGRQMWHNVTYQLSGFRETNECWRDLHVPPGARLARDRNARSVVLACSGSGTEETRNQFNYLNALYPSHRQMNWTGSTLLLTAGGNEVQSADGSLYVDLITRCFIQLRCHRRRRNQISNLEEIQTRLTNLLTQVVTTASRATIRILGYPRLMKPDPFCVLVLGISTGEAKWIDRLTLDLNNRTAQAVQSIQALHPDVDIQYVDVDDYLNVGACGFRRKKRHIQDIDAYLWHIKSHTSPDAAGLLCVLSGPFG
jgi:hypothetical protein